MQNLFNEVTSLDQRCYKEYGLSEDLLMEHAADGMADYIHNQYENDERICIVCGSGNNGADGIALARLLYKDFDVTLFLTKEPRSEMAKLQLKRAEAIGVNLVNTLQESDILVDALFGSGLSRDFDTETVELIQAMNALQADKIACDIPSGLKTDGTLQAVTFEADVTLTMGALKRGLFSDAAKEVVGSVYVRTLGSVEASMRQRVLGNFLTNQTFCCLTVMKKTVIKEVMAICHLSVVKSLEPLLWQVLLLYVLVLVW